MNHILIPVCTFILFTSLARGQTVISLPESSSLNLRMSDMAVLPSGDGDDEKDPAYKLYKAGYALILDDKWTEAMKQLAEIQAKFPKSDYLDDAAYWSAYAQMRIDRQKGIAAYKKFLKDFPESSYADDAMADMESHVTTVVSGDARNVHVAHSPGTYSYSYGSTPAASQAAMRDAQRAMREAQREMRASGMRMRAPMAPMTPMIWSSQSGDKEKKLDPKTRVKLAALQALGESENDKEAFAILKEVALDKSQPEVMRITAIQSLEDFRKFDVLPVLIEVAKSDPNEGIQLTAIQTISDCSSDKNKSAEALITLFNSLQKQKDKQRQTALYAIADIGNDKAVDFLAKIATTDEDYDLRSDAVYYLGNIGNEKSRAALMQILKTK